MLYQTGLSSIDYLNQSSIQPDIRLQATPRILENADTLMKDTDVDTRRPLIALNPGASFGPAKRWFPERYAALADRLVQEADAEVLLLGSTSEAAIARQISNQMSQKTNNLVGRTDLPALIGIISRCQLVVGNDSGPMHLAAALGIPQVAIFGSTDEKATGPFNPKAVVPAQARRVQPLPAARVPHRSTLFRSDSGGGGDGSVGGAVESGCLAPTSASPET